MKINNVATGAMLMTAVFILAPGLTGYVQAATLYWDANGATAGAGTSPQGDWNTSAFWSTYVDGASATELYTALAGTTNDVVFSAGADATGVYTVMVQNVTSANAVNSIKVEEGTVTLKNQTTGRSVVMTGNAEVNVASGAALGANVVLAGSTSLKKTGNGTMTLSSVATYTGATHIMAGTLLVGNSDVLPDGSAVTVDSGATLSCQSGAGRMDRVGSLAGAGNLVLKYATVAGTAFACGSNNTSTEFSGVISSVSTHEGSFVKEGTGRLTLSGDNTYWMQTLVSGGSLIVNGNQAAATNVLTVAAGAALGGNGTVGGDVNFNAGAKFHFSENAALTVVPGKSVSFESFGVNNIDGLDAGTSPGTYSLISGNVNFANISNIGNANGFDLGGGKSAYFDVEAGSLKLVVKGGAKLSLILLSSVVPFPPHSSFFL